MYRIGKKYDEVAKLVGDIYIDYDLKGFPVDVTVACQKLGVALVPYSEYSNVEKALLLKKSESGFYVPPTVESAPMIFYNNDISVVGSCGNMRRNIMHEVFHYINGDTREDPDNDDLADYFGKYFLAPISYLIAAQIENPNEIIGKFEVDSTMAYYITKNINNRKMKYGNKIFDYEKPLLQHILGDLYCLYVDE